MVMPKNEVPSMREADFEVVQRQRDLPSTTVSLALPSSILSNAQSPELRMYLAGQVARAAAIFRIDEVIIFDERDDKRATNNVDGKRKRHTTDDSSPTAFFQQVLEYLETPQYLRRHLFPVSNDLRYVGLLNPLALPSHVARNDFCRWREGVAVGRVHSKQRGRWGNQQGQSPAYDTAPPTRYVEVGQERLVEINTTISVGERVTIDMEPSGPEYASCPGKYLFGRLADRLEPKAHGLYWGYRVRVADSLSSVFSGSTVAPKGYDVTVGTSERGTTIAEGLDDAASFQLPEYSHILIVFGGVHGLERSVEGDEKLQALGICSEKTSEQHEPSANQYDVAELFDYYVNTCPNQGSRTIRTEEAILISLAVLQPYLKPRRS